MKHSITRVDKPRQHQNQQSGYYWWAVTILNMLVFVCFEALGVGGSLHMLAYTKQVLNMTSERSNF